MDSIDTLVGEVRGVTVVLRPVEIVAKQHGYHRDYIKRLCAEGVLIASKPVRDWFVEVNLSRISTLTALDNDT